MSILGSIANGIYGLVGSYATHRENERNRQFAAEQAEIARRENYQYGELSANAADARQRAQFSDMFSPSAQMRLIKEAGLSPSMMYQGTGVQGQATGQQGGGANGPSTAMPDIFNPVQGAMQAAQLGQIYANTSLLNAQRGKVEQETKNLELDQTTKEIMNTMKKLEQQIYNQENSIFSDIKWTNADGTPTTLWNMAEDSANFEKFKDKVYKAMESSELNEAMWKSEKTTEALMDYYEKTRKFGTNLTTLSNIEENNVFHTSLTNALNNQEFINLSAKDAIQKLKASVETNELTETQKKAWNRLLNRLEDGTTKDILIVAGMILNNALSNYNMPRMGNTYNKNNYIE